MASIYLAPYSIVLRKSHTKNNVLFKEGFSKPTLQSAVNNYFKKLEAGFYDDAKVNSLFKVSKLIDDKSSSTIHGIIDSGEYGIESKFYDKAGSHKYDRLKDHAEVMPFYFMLYLPQDASLGFIILQRFGQYGIAKSFNSGIASYLKTLAPGYQIEISPVISTTVLHKIIDEGRIRKAIFTKYTIPKDLEDYFSPNGVKEDGYLEMAMIAKRNSQLNIKNKLKKVMFGTGKRDSLLKINNFDYDEMRVTVDYGGGKRTINIGDNNFRAFYDVTANIKKDANGHPNFLSIRKEASTLLVDLDKLI